MFTATVALVIWLGVFLLPTMLMYGLPLWIAWRIAKALWNRGRKPQAVPAGD